MTMKQTIKDKMLEAIFVQTGGRPENPKIAEICADIAVGFISSNGLSEMEINHQIQKHFDIANDLAIKEVERLARQVLRNNPKEVLNFTMAMGSYFFSDNQDEIIHTVVGGNESFLKSLEGYNELKEFIAKWDEYFGLTGTPMTFTADGEMITNW